MAKLKCANILPLIPLLADDVLSAAESDRLKKHLSVCPDCRREFDLYRAMKHATASLSSPSLSSDFHENLMKTIKEEKTTQSKRTSSLHPHLRRRTMGYVATAAAAAVVALSVVTQSQVLIPGTPDAFPSDNLDNFVTPQVTQSQVAQPQVTQSQGARSQGAQPRVTKPQAALSPTNAPTPSIDSQVTQPQATQPQATPSQVAQPQGTPRHDAPAQESTAPAASCGIVAEEPQQTVATYRVFIKTAHLAEAQKMLADCPQDEHGYRVENGTASLLEALSALPGYRTECIENDAAQPLTADYILLIGE